MNKILENIKQKTGDKFYKTMNLISKELLKSGYKIIQIKDALYITGKNVVDSEVSVFDRTFKAHLWIENESCKEIMYAIRF